MALHACRGFHSSKSQGDYMKTTIPNFLLAAVVVAAGMVGAQSALAYCFSNDLLSHGTMKVVWLDPSTVNKKASDFTQISKCDALPAAAKKKCKSLRDNYEKKKKGAAEDIIEFVTGLPLVGDPIKDAGSYAERKFAEYGAWQTDLIDDIVGKFTTDFRKDVKPGATECCRYTDKSCNPSGRKDGENWFRITVPWPKDLPKNKTLRSKAGQMIRLVKIGATDHMECRNDTGSVSRTGCRNFVFPEGPYRPNKGRAKYNVMLKSKDTGKCLDVSGWDKKNGANVHLWKCTGKQNQRWDIYENGIVKSRMNGKCLDVSGATKAGKNGQNVHMWDCHGLNNQRWRFVNDLMISDARGSHNWCMEVGGWNKKDGANVNIWQCGNGQANQTWYAKK